MCMSIGRIRDRRIYTCLGTGLLAAVGDDTLPAIQLIASPNRHCSQRPPLLKCPQLMMMPGIQIDTQYGRCPGRNGAQLSMHNDTPQPFHFQTRHSRWQGAEGDGRVHEYLIFRRRRRVTNTRYAAHSPERHKCVHRLGHRHRPSVCESRVCRCRGGVVVM